MTKFELADKILRLLFNYGMEYSAPISNALFETLINVKATEEEQQIVIRFLIDETELCKRTESSPDSLISLTSAGFKVINEHDSYSAYLEHQKQVEIQQKLAQEQQAVKEAAQEKNAQEKQVLLELQSEIQRKQQEEKETRWWKVETRRYWLLVFLAVVPIALSFHECNRSDSNTKEPAPVERTMPTNAHSKPLPTSSDTTVADSMNMTVKVDSVPSDSIKGKRSL